MLRRSDGKQTSKRGFTSQRAAHDAYRRVVEQIDRGELRHTDETFGSWWETWLRRRRPYLEPNAWRAYDVDGRIRLLPAFEDTRLDKLDVEQVRSWMEQQAEAVEAGEAAPKTVNNALGTLVVCLNAAVKDRVIAANPAVASIAFHALTSSATTYVCRRSPSYLDACLDATGRSRRCCSMPGYGSPRRSPCRSATSSSRTPEGVIVVYRSQKKTHFGQRHGSTKGDRFRSVEIGPHLSGVLTDQIARREESGTGKQPDAPCS